jgi:Cation transporter/ATPase, N-terminus
VPLTAAVQLYSSLTQLQHVRSMYSLLSAHSASSCGSIYRINRIFTGNVPCLSPVRKLRWFSALSHDIYTNASSLPWSLFYTHKAGLIAAAKNDLIKPPQTFREVTPDKLYNLVSSAQEAKENKERLDKEFGGTLQLAASLGVDLIRGLSGDQVVKQREKFGNNCFPEPPMKGFWKLFFEAFHDTILLVLIAAAIVSLIVGMIEEPGHGWIEGVAILIAVLIVALVTAANDYSKELQFRALEKTSEETERAMVLRNGETMQVHSSAYF